jgi:predicted DCC family thiol-disulfide oxidoreductase YuxK
MQPVSTPATGKGLIVFFDGDCPLCRAEIGLYRACAGAERVAFVDVATADAGEVAEGLDKEAALARFHVQTGDGRLHSGAAGFAQLWLTLPRWRWLGRVTLLPGIRTIAERAYCGFLRVRPAVQWLWRRAAKTPTAKTPTAKTPTAKTPSAKAPTSAVDP